MILKHYFIMVTLSLSIGFILGRTSIDNPQQADEIALVDKNNEAAKTKIDIKPPQKEITKDQKTDNKKSESKSIDYDAYDYEVSYQESLKAWNESIELFFINTPDLEENKLTQYQELKKKLREEKDKAWNEIRESTRVGENEFLFNTTYQEDLRLFEIRKKYHKKLKNLLGTENYNKLQKKIKDCKTEQIHKAKNNIPHGHCPNF